MKILEMHIYGYGQLENVKLTNLADFQVFYGENEAGKSTIMAFIHSILFGFPTKVQSELRYEPKHSTKYGGKIRIYHEELGYAVIERVKGKAAGDVIVAMDNGRIGGEELLKEIVANFDKSLFQAVFSYNIHGLQNIHQMKGEDISKFLFSAGTLGTERLSETEIILQKELDTRFKPSGKKPFLNGKLQELHEINGELKKAAAKSKEYDSLVKKRELLQQEMTAINSSIKGLSEKVEKMNEWKRIGPLVRKKEWIKNELDALGEINFPSRGIERIEKLNQLIHPYNAEIMSIKARIENLQKELIDIQPDDTLLENEPAILTFLDQVPLFEQLNLEKHKCETQLMECDESLSVTREKLHLPIKEEEISSINTNIYMKNQVEIISRKRQKLVDAKEELDVLYQDEKSALEEIEKEVRSAERKVLTKQDRLLLEEQVSTGNDKKTIEVELKAIQEKIDFFQQAEERNRAAGSSERKQKQLQFFLFESILLGLVFYGLLTKQWVLLFLGVLGAIVVAFLMKRGFKQSNVNDMGPTLNRLREKETLLKQKLQSAQFMDFAKLEEQLRLDIQRCEELQILNIKLKQQQLQVDKVIAKFEEWELESSQNMDKLLSVGRELRIPEYVATTFLLEAFELIEQFKSICREKKQLGTKLQQINQEQNKMQETLNQYENRFLREKGTGLHNTAYLLRNRLKEEHENQIKSKERNGKLVDFEADLMQKSQELEHLKAEYNKLLGAAGVKTEKQFYEQGDFAEKRERLLGELQHIQSQLQYSILPKNIQKSYFPIHNCDDIINEANHQVELLQAEIENLQEEQASIKYEIQILEEGGTYSNILHNFKQKKFELEEAAKEWSLYRLAQEILMNTIEKYKNVHLPRMLTKAEEYLTFLTSGSYHKIHLQQTGTGFLVERSDRTLFEANELSQATTEQLYVSIRLALATTLYEKYQFPIIIDDSFVNFDANRTKKVIELLQKLERNQILFFTCHGHLLELFQRENVLWLEKGAVQIIS